MFLFLFYLLIGHVDVMVHVKAQTIKLPSTTEVGYGLSEFSGLNAEENYTAKALEHAKAGDEEKALEYFRAAVHFYPVRLNF